jgi:ABC-2 type transport system ATP-binding protein
VSLRVEGLTKRFGKKPAVNDLSFDVKAGELVGFIGPNGAGKTTSLQCIAGFLRPDAGRISVDGIVIEKERGRLISLIAETPDVYPMLTLWEHLAFVARGSRLTDWEPRAESLLARFNLLSERNTLGQAASKGMRQKTLIAATLLARTRVVLLDEPMIGLDPQGQRELRSLIADLRSDGLAIVMSTHQIDSAQDMCERVVILNRGSVVANGTFDELREQRDPDSSLESIYFDLTAT